MRILSSLLAVSLGCYFHATSALYSKQGDVQILHAKSLEKTIKASDQITLVEFFAPWCGHCKNLAPIYNKVATTLKGMVNVAAIDCDDDSNKSICGKYEIKGFPTLKVMRTKVNKSGGRSVSAEDYNGQRTVKAIAEHLTSIMPSTVQKIDDRSLRDFLSQGNETAKVVLFTKKGATPSIFKALSTSSFDRSFIFAQIRDTQIASVELFNIKDFPTLVLLPGGDNPSLVYQGDMKLGKLQSFLSAFASGTSEAEMPSSQATKDPKNNDSGKYLPNTLSAPKFNVVEVKATTASDVSKTKILADKRDVDNLLFGNTIKTAVLVPAGLLADSSVKAGPQEPAYFYYTPEAGQQLEMLLGIAGNPVIFVNSRKAWFVAAPDLPTTTDTLHEFVDKVKQGEAGKKIKFSVQEQKTEL